MLYSPPGVEALVSLAADQKSPCIEAASPACEPTSHSDMEINVSPAHDAAPSSSGAAAADAEDDAAPSHAAAGVEAAPGVEAPASTHEFSR